MKQTAAGGGVCAGIMGMLLAGFASLPLPALAQEFSVGIDRSTGEVICIDDGDTGQPGGTQLMDPSYARAAAWDALYNPLALGRCGASELTPLDGGTWGASRPFSGADAAGRTADFRLYVLSDRFNWKLGSVNTLEEDGQPASLGAILSTPQFFERFCSAKAVFSIGAASHEGPTGPNHRLAGARAETVTDGLGAIRPQCPAGRIPLLFALSLGENQNPNPGRSSAAQRRVVIVAAEDIAIDVNLEQALREGIRQQDVFSGLSVDEYDLFVLDAM